MGSGVHVVAQCIAGGAIIFVELFVSVVLHRKMVSRSPFHDLQVDIMVMYQPILYA